MSTSKACKNGCSRSSTTSLVTNLKASTPIKICSSSSTRRQNSTVTEWRCGYCPRTKIRTPTVYTYGRVQSMALEVAGALVQRGVKAGDRVSVDERKPTGVGHQLFRDPQSRRHGSACGFPSVLDGNAKRREPRRLGGTLLISERVAKRLANEGNQSDSASSKKRLVGRRVSRSASQSAG